VLRPIPRWDSSQRSPDPLAGGGKGAEGNREEKGRRRWEGDEGGERMIPGP